MKEILLDFLQFAAAIVGSLFAILGLLTDYRDKKGRVTRWGKVAVVGVILSTGISVITIGLQQRRGRDAKAASDREKLAVQIRTELILDSIDRTLLPLRDIVVDVETRFPIDTPEQQPYLRRVEYTSYDGMLHGLTYPLADREREPQCDNDAEWLPCVLAKPLNYRLRFYKSGHNAGELVLWIRANEAKTQEILVRGSYWRHVSRGMAVSAKDVWVSGSIKSARDLEDCEAWLQILPSDANLPSSQLDDWLATNLETDAARCSIAFGGRRIDLSLQAVREGPRGWGQYSGSVGRGIR